MGRHFFFLFKKDFQMMLSGKFPLLVLGSLVLYSCYINFVYIHIDQDIYPVCLYDPMLNMQEVSDRMIRVNTMAELEKITSDGYAVGIDASEDNLRIIMMTSGLDRTDQLRTAYALSLLSAEPNTAAKTIGQNSKEMKSRREITSEFLFFELAAVGLLGLASIIFKEKHMGVIRVHGTMPVSRSLFLFSKSLLFLLTDLIFACLLILINLGLEEGFAVLPAVWMQTGILSLIITLVGFFCAVWLPDFKQFSLLYLVLAVFITTPVFLAGQTSVTWNWINIHPMYHLFMAIKNACFKTPAGGAVYYIISAVSIGFLILFAHRALTREMTKEG